VLTIEDNDTTYQPDLLVKGPANTTYKGNDLYNTLIGQTSSTRVKKGKSKTFYVKFQNDGTGPDQFAVKAKPGNADFSVRYFRGTKNISQAVIAGAKETPVLAPGASWIIRVVIAPKLASRVGDAFSDVISGQS